MCDRPAEYKTAENTPPQKSSGSNLYYSPVRQLEEQREFYLRKIFDIQVAIDALKRV